jgi:hypothetical protein
VASQEKDLTNLGLVLLNCIEGHVLPAERRKPQFIKEQRQHNKVFRLGKAEL